MASSIIDLKTYLQRQKEVFDAYIATKGQEMSLIPLLQKYSSEDGQEYEPKQLLNYLNSYLKSKRITKEELASFNKTKLVANEIIFKRGKTIVEALIEAFGSLKGIDEYRYIFAKNDGKINPYSEAYLIKCRDYYLKHTKNSNLVTSYNNVMDLAKRGKYDIELILKILSIKEDSEALKFINRISISQTNLKKLIAEYETLNPANTLEVSRLKGLATKAYNFEPKKEKFVIKTSAYENLNSRLRSLRQIIEEYLISDEEDISVFFTKYNFNEFKFQEVLKDAKTGHDALLNSLINKYEAKEEAIRNSYKSVIKAIMQAKYNGINYGYGYRELNLYDFYLLKEGLDPKTLKKYAGIIYDNADYVAIKNVIEEFAIGKVFTSKQELKDYYDITDNDNDLILDYMEYASLPLTIKMFEAVCERYNNKDITIEIEEKEAVVNI